MSTAIELFHDLFLESGHVDFQSFDVLCLRRMTVNQVRSLCKVARELIKDDLERSEEQ